MLILGCILVLITLFLLIKRYEARMVLVAAGIVMCACAGNPMAALNSFAKGMGSSMISSACSSMGFALVMRFTGCDKHLINFLAKGLTKVHFLIIPGVVLATFAVNMALPSAAGTAAAAGAIFIPIMMGAGIHPAMAAAAVKCGTYGSMLNPGLAHNPFVAKIAGVGVMDVIAFHYKANLASLVIAAITITVIAYMTHENKDHFAEGLELEENFKVNYLYALMPIIPIAILLLGATKIVPMFKMGVAQAMIIGCVLALAVTKTNPAELTKSFFDGMGKAYADIIGIIISAGVFVAGMNAMGLVKAFTNAMLNNPAIVKIAASVGPFLLGLIVGSGDAATFAFNEAITPHAADFGMTPVQMGSMATLGGTLGRTMSPIAGATIIVAGIAGVNPMEIAKRNALPMVLAMVVGMTVLVMQ
ncbi:MAG: C4-dicarboxylate transporter DcuC [Phascolarctobacterium succinatutens]|uniref:C4-dicarboxylate transporter DcuC n=1 Tax=Phascolarctobacterium succinatutens TaxID=626940 RepID=UPI0026F31892|nr:C4-dicarboxylate transporter DcuC [Phascolarctobacterium succinatutens]